MRLPIMLGLVGLAASTYVVDKTNQDQAFNGIGGLSGGGATSRLLVDYKEPMRTQILDYLFKPNFGANLQILKVEIGGDSQSTDGTETSHMHSKDDLDVTRGYEWWLMKEAKARNPDIKLYGLPWAFPGWVGNDPTTGVPSGSPFTYPNQTSNYILQWIKGAKNTHGLDIDYIGIWNERSSSASYAQSLRDTFAQNGFGDIKIVAKDGGADICTTLQQDPAYAKTVDIIGLHYPSDYSDYSVCHSLNKPVWASEESSSYDDYNGAACWARVTASHYVLSGMTASIMWNLVGAYYHGTNWYASSMLTSVQPWSGFWENMEVVWATAHITQFTKIGWKYLKNGSGSGQLTNGGFYTTLVDPTGTDFTIIVVKISHEHAPCTRPGLPKETVNPETATFKLAADMGNVSTLAFWRSNFEAATKMEFEKQPDMQIANGEFTIPIALGDFFTFSTVRTATKGAYTPPASVPSFPLPHSDDFDGVVNGQEAPLCADQIGAFEVHPDSKNTSNKIMRQMVPQLPIGWSDHGSNGPMTLIGMKEWQDVTVQVDFRLPVPQATGCVATRVNQMWANGIALCVAVDGHWNLTYGGPPQSGQFTTKPIASGSVSAIGLNNWCNLKLTTVNDTAQAWINGAQVLNTHIRNIDNGFAAFGLNEWFQVEFDNLNIAQAGTNWAPPAKCPAAVGTPLVMKNCQPNGVFDEAMGFQLTSQWHIVHKASGLCVTKANGVTLQTCSFTDLNQQFQNDYTRIRNTVVPMTLYGTSERLVGSLDGSVGVSSSAPSHGWNTWSYFPNTFQLRNQYDTNTGLGYPKCLSVCK
eukprot:TRINITY_DN3336_c1_g1_i1.p1 TRINITY_DN3336_c1_g1~~TRINITY_DN3336_c1_g1_i1.p1  ORF type:complete len:825 (+),score=228.69 TRINITY_DN3336_c1_g1_i1:51-2477(+)